MTNVLAVQHWLKPDTNNASMASDTTNPADKLKLYSRWISECFEMLHKMMQQKISLNVMAVNDQEIGHVTSYLWFVSKREKHCEVQCFAVAAKCLAYHMLTAWRHINTIAITTLLQLASLHTTDVRNFTHWLIDWVRLNVPPNTL